MLADYQPGDEVIPAHQQAAVRAGAAVAALGALGELQPPDALYLAVLLTSPPPGAAHLSEVTIAHLGTIRAYWLPVGAAKAEPLTTDHIRPGTTDEWITASLGATTATSSPTITSFRPDQPGTVLVTINRQLTIADLPVDPLAAVQRLADHALAQGGEDNITVIAIAITASRP